MTKMQDWCSVCHRLMHIKRKGFITLSNNIQSILSPPPPIPVGKTTKEVEQGSDWDGTRDLQIQCVKYEPVNFRLGCLWENSALFNVFKICITNFVLAWLNIDQGVMFGLLKKTTTTKYAPQTLFEKQNLSDLAWWYHHHHHNPTECYLTWSAETWCL